MGVAELVPRFIDGSLRPAHDPRWAASGARTPEEYEYWSSKACGLACLRMILGWRGLPVLTLMRLVERALAWKAYIPAGGTGVPVAARLFSVWASKRRSASRPATSGPAGLRHLPG